MKEQPVTDALLRQFLLGKVDDEERQRIESLFLTDPLSRERILAAEQDLIEDYLDDGLTPADRDKFLQHYGETPTQRRKLRIAKTVQDWVTGGAALTPSAPATVSGWSRWRARMRLKPVLVIPIAVTAMIAIVVATVLVNRQWEQRNLEEELARLNSAASLREVPTDLLAMELRPGSVRSVESENRLIKRSDVRIVELKLLWIQRERYPKYQAVVRRFSGEWQYVIRELQSENRGGQIIRVRLPIRILTRGLYQIFLSGVAADGTVSSPEEYTFTVDS